MAEYIDREAVERLVSDACEECREACLEFDGIYADCHQCIFERVKDGVPKIPAADVVPVRHGHWIDTFGDSWTCSVCGAETYTDEDWRKTDERSYQMNYCHYCGAKMDGAE